MGYMSPFPRGTRVSQEFGTNPGGYNPPGGHTGRDYAVPVGTPVRAAGDGVIELSSWVSDNYLANEWWLTRYGGDMLVLNCGENAPTFIYAHLSDSTANVGDRVRKGQIIGKTGNTGTATSGPHCHVEELPPRWAFDNGTYGRVEPYFTEFYSFIPINTQSAPVKPPTVKASTEKMLIITKAKGDTAVWIGDGISRRQIPDTKTLEDYRKLANWGVLNIYRNGETMDYPPAVLGEIVGAK